MDTTSDFSGIADEIRASVQITTSFHQMQYIGVLYGKLLQGDDKVGALTDILSKLAEAKITVTALDAVTAGEGRFGAIFWVQPKDVAKTAKLLGAT
ncbi:MAG: hypothetical protein ACREX4_11615 [Gammaproteobacteria bacterium]